MKNLDGKIFEERFVVDRGFRLKFKSRGNEVIRRICVLTLRRTDRREWTRIIARIFVFTKETTVSVMISPRFDRLTIKRDKRVFIKRIQSLMLSFTPVFVIGSTRTGIRSLISSEQSLPPSTIRLRLKHSNSYQVAQNERQRNGWDCDQTLLWMPVGIFPPKNHTGLVHLHNPIHDYLPILCEYIVPIDILVDLGDRSTIIDIRQDLHLLPSGDSRKCHNTNEKEF